jgi:hypothetical protein
MLKILLILFFFSTLQLMFTFFIFDIAFFNFCYSFFIKISQYVFFTFVRELVQTHFYNVFFPYIVKFYPEFLLFFFFIEYFLYLLVLCYIFYNIIGIFFLPITLAYPRSFLLKVSAFRRTLRKIILRFLRFLWWYFSFRAGFYFVKLLFIPLFELLFFY